MKEARRQSKSGGSEDLSGGLDSLSFDDKDSEKKSKKKSKKKKDKNVQEPSKPESEDLFALDWSSGSSSQPPQQQHKVAPLTSETSMPLELQMELVIIVVVSVMTISAVFKVAATLDYRRRTLVAASEILTTMGLHKI